MKFEATEVEESDGWVTGYNTGGETSVQCGAKWQTVKKMRQ